MKNSTKEQRGSCDTAKTFTDSDKIRTAIISDNVKGLEKLLGASKEHFSLAFGRFPLLSLAYLYSSHKIINKYERTLSKVTEYIQVEEYAEDYLKFKKYAKKSLRLYLNGQIITPLEMSAIIGDGQGVSTNISNTQNLDRVKKIYLLTHGVNVKKSGNSIVVPRSKKPSFNQIVAVLSIVAVCAVFLLGGVISLEVIPSLLGGDGTIDSPIKIISPHLFELAMEEDGRYYVLEEDLVLEGSNWESKEFKMHLDGQGKTITIKGAHDTALIEKLSGSLVNVNLVFEEIDKGLPKNSAFFVNSISGKIENVNIQMPNLSLTATTEGALVAYVSTGKISNVKLETNGVINEVSTLEETILGTLIYKNMGIVENCEVKYNYSITGDAKNSSGEEGGTSYGDAVFGGIVGINGGTLKDSTILEGSTLQTDTLDIGGAVVENQDKATITNVKNYANLTQHTDSSYWSPNIGGIAMRNYGKITSSHNHGKIEAHTTQQTSSTALILGGITTVNSGTIDKCLNKGEVVGSVTVGVLNLGGLCYVNEGIITNSTNEGNIDCEINTPEDLPLNASVLFEHHISGGISINYGSLSYFKNTGDVTTHSSKQSFTFVGGAVAVNNNKTAVIDHAQNLGNITSNTTQTEERSVFVGGISALLIGKLTNSINLGSFHTESEEGEVVAGGIIGFTEISGYSGNNSYSPLYEWSKNYYLNDVGYGVGVGNYFVYDIDPFFNIVINKYYADGADVGATPADIDTIKNSGVYW